MDISHLTLETTFRTLTPFADTLTKGKLSGGMDDVGDRAAAARICCLEGADFFGAVEDAARIGMAPGSISKIVTEAQDMAEARRLLADPSLIVELDGVRTTADDDVEIPDGDASPPQLPED